MAKKFEYKRLVYAQKSIWDASIKPEILEEMDKTMNELGAKGWELVSVNDAETGGGSVHKMVLFFKREI